jgi:FSR family fosmidomycin resistance protein-like MFS transporter
VPLLFGLIGFAAGTGGPSRDVIVKRAAPANATGRVYGVVYSGLDIGQAISPLLIASAFNVRKVRRTVAA